MTDFFPRPLGLPEVPRYFTYHIEVNKGQEPDFSRMSQKDIRLIRRYLHRNSEKIPHYGRTVLRPAWKKEPSLSEANRTREAVH